MLGIKHNPDLFSWTTHHELKFLEGLGTHSAVKQTRGQLLVSYLIAADKRAFWGNISPAIVLPKARELLAQETIAAAQNKSD